MTILLSTYISVLLSGDSLMYHQSMAFSTFDRDNDVTVDRNCAIWHGFGWWFSSCRRANLNGVYRRSKGIVWQTWKGLSYGLSPTKMLITKK